MRFQIQQKIRSGEDMMMDSPAFQGYIFEEMHCKDGIIVMTMKNETGEGTMRYIETFPGITLTYNHLEMQTCYQQVDTMSVFISLNYCRKGCFEVILDSGSFGYT